MQKYNTRDGCFGVTGEIIVDYIYAYDEEKRFSMYIKVVT